METELDRRRKEKTDGVGGEYPDAITWSQEIASEEVQLDHGAIQLVFAMASLFTTSEALRQALLDICQHAELVEPLRAEATDAIATSGVSAAALANMHLLDSVLKESQRLGPPAIVGLERQAVRDTTMPDRTLLPRGSIIAVDSSDMWDPKINTYPEKFDGYRYWKMREAGDIGTAFVSSSKEHNVFGMGKHICPGRFLAAVEIKLCLVHILLKYDVRLREGYQPTPIKNGLF
ncbi:Putative cytochrome P450 [Septoria linicola]|uniref:Cytochrome P450 n=1 Tax=Septoria linicola TaxID=215465 RepID=A0A9Q9EPV3_9PEZI|nr:Putative cytochrome P450 [Septoria linicola]